MVYSRFNVTIVIVCFIVVWSCRTNVKNDNISSENSKISEGKFLAEQYCQGCHLLPDPTSINKSNWVNHVLPQMGPRLGITKHNGKTYPSYKDDPDLDPGYYPEKPLMSAQEWQKILDYYEGSSPDSLAFNQMHDSISIMDNLPGFQIMKPASDYYLPATSFITIDTNGSRPLIIRGDALRRAVVFYNQNLKQVDTVTVPFTISDAGRISTNEIMTTFIGELQPNNRKTGFLGKLENVSGKWKYVPEKLFHPLRRPVQFVRYDFNKDGYMDVVICEFGHLNGSLTFYSGKADNTFEKRILKNTPGAIQIQLSDYNKDGLQDIWALFSQGDEAIVLFTNKGDGSFDEKVIQRFGPVSGSSYFELKDFNNDGLQDILYTAGDNGDFSMVMKPYHGVYIFLNEGNNRFEQAYFFPLNGSFKATAEDFDKDGDLDISAIAYFADFAHYPYEGFVYLENKGMLKFVPMTFKDSDKGRWLTMDVGDLDRDGWPDIVLGNMSVGPTVSMPLTDWKKGPPFILLKNRHMKGTHKTGKK